MVFKNIVLIGAGGNLGPSILNSLITSPHGYSVSALSRESSSYQPPAGVKLLKTDYTPASLVAAFKGQDVVVSAISGTGFADQTKVIDAAIAAGVKRFIPSEFGSDTSNPVGVQRFPPWGQKAEVRKYLESKQDHIEWTAIFTGLFFDWTLKAGFTGFKIAESKATIYTKYKDVAFSATTLGTIGRAVAQALAPSIAPKTANKILRVRSVTTSQSNILAAFEDVTGKKWAIQEVDLDKAVLEAEEKLKQGDFSAAGPLILGANLDVRTGNNFDQQGEVSNAVLELPNEDLKTIIKSVL